MTFEFKMTDLVKQVDDADIVAIDKLANEVSFKWRSLKVAM